VGEPSVTSSAFFAGTRFAESNDDYPWGSAILAVESRARARREPAIGGVVLDDDVTRLDGIKEREDLIATDATTPLHLIRQKELELSGKVLKAREQAAEIVADARHEAVEIASLAEADAEQEAKTYETKRMEEAQVEIAQMRASVGPEIEAIRAVVDQRHDAAVAAVVERVTRV
jgi:vacuolar-type H+-ATPase subunit H